VSKDRFIPFDTAVTAFVFAVTSAVTPAILVSICVAAFGDFSGPYVTSIWHYYAVVSVISWPVTAISTLLPYAVGIAIANRFKLFHWLYFVAGATLTALALLAVPWPSLITIGFREPDRPLAQVFLSGAPLYAVCGAAGGFTCWLTVRRKIAQRVAHCSSGKVS
jgi:hypothetical protein